MPPFRYLGNILGCAGVRFCLGVGVFRLGRGRGKAGIALERSR